MRKNILFIEQNLNPTMGGVERVTYILSKEFERLGYKCFYAYSNVDNSGIDASLIIKYENDRGKNSLREIVQFIDHNQINIIVSQGVCNKNVIKLFGIVKKYGNMKSIFCFHMSPGYERYIPYPNSLSQKIKERIKNTLPIKRNRIKEISQLADNVVVLSASFVDSFRKEYAINPTCEIISIPNPLTFDTCITDDKLKEKKKVVLIVSRLLECQKNISSALRIWRKIGEVGHNGWTLKIIGDGPDKLNYMRFVVENKVANVYFGGAQTDVKVYYEEASVFLMTSHFEGFGMTVTEALQNGCIPIVYNNYAALHDIIVNEFNGFIIPSNDELQFANKLSSIIYNQIDILPLIKNGLNTIEKFKINNIIIEWIKIMKFS